MIKINNIDKIKIKILRIIITLSKRSIQKIFKFLVVVLSFYL